VDRDDARLIIEALDSRISGDRETLDRLASTSLVQLMAAAARVRALAAGWPPAFIAAAEIESICRRGEKIVDDDGAPTSNLVIFVDKLRGLVDEPAPTKPNRAQRRKHDLEALSRQADCRRRAGVPRVSRGDFDPPNTKRRRPTPEQLRGLELAGRRSCELRKRGELEVRHGAALVASLGPDEGFLTWQSSPHVMWLDRRLWLRSLL
jgi:hypothetical protein